MTYSIGNVSSRSTASGVVAEPIGGVPQNQSTPIGSPPQFSSPLVTDRRGLPAKLTLPAFASRRAEHKDSAGGLQHEKEAAFSAASDAPVTRTSAHDSSGGDGQAGDEKQHSLRLQANQLYQSEQQAFAQACSSKHPEVQEIMRCGVALMLSSIECIDAGAKKTSEFRQIVDEVHRHFQRTGVKLPVGIEPLTALIQTLNAPRPHMASSSSGVSALLLPALMQMGRQQIELSSPVPMKPVSQEEARAYFGRQWRISA